MGVVISLGGSVFNVNKTPEEISEIASSIKKVHENIERLGIVVGGGPLAREYINIGRKIGLGEFQCDLLGIEVSRLNALLLSLLVDGVGPLNSIEKASHLMMEGKLVVMGGTEPGHTTDCVAALLAEATSSELFIVSDVGYVYTEDPKRNEEAEPLEEVTLETLRKFSARGRAGPHGVLDLSAIEVISRSKIRTWFIPKEEITNIPNVKGTKVKL